MNIKDSIFPIFFEYSDYPAQSGTCFVLNFSNSFFLVTAYHCIEGHDLNMIAITNFRSKKEKISLPISSMLYGKTKTKPEVNLDIAVFVIDKKAVSRSVTKSIGGGKINEVIKNETNNPIMRTLCKYTSDLRSIEYSKKVLDESNKEIKSLVNNANNSLIEVAALSLSDKPIQFNNIYTIYGFPLALGSWSENSIDRKAECLERTDVAIYGAMGDSYSLAIKKQNNNFDGFSGAPVLTKDNLVIGIVSYTAEKKLVFISSERIKEIIEHSLSMKSV